MTEPEARTTRAREELARDVIQYVMANDILTQHGMKGLRSRLEAAIPDDVALFYDAMLQRVADLMSAQAGTRDGFALDVLASGIEAYEKKAFHFPALPQRLPGGGTPGCIDPNCEYGKEPPTRDDIALVVLDELTGATGLADDWLCPQDDETARDMCLDIADKIIALTSPLSRPNLGGGE